MASPKSRISRARRGARRAHTALHAARAIKCPRCSSLRQAHCVCPSCGYYKNQEVIPAPIKAE